MLAFLGLTLSSRGAFCITCLILKLCVRYGVNGCEIRTTSRIPTTEFSQTGTLNIGIIASLHEYEAKVLCSTKIRHLSSLQMIESIVFAINEINAKRLVHPNVTLGFKIVDDCSNGITAIAKAFYLMHDCSLSPTSKKNDVVAVILTDSSPITLKTAHFFSSFKIPQISFKASAITLDDQKRYSYFFRTIPNSAMQVQVIVDILVKFQWSYVSIVYVDNIYGTLLFEGIGKLLNQIGYCFAVVRKIHPESKLSIYVETATALSADPNASVVIVALSVDEAIKLFKVFANNWRSNRTWIAAESIGSRVDELIDIKHVVSGMLAISYDSCSVARFDDFFKYLTVYNGSRNPWFGKFFDSAFNFRLHLNASSFMRHVPIMQSPHYKPEKTSSQSIDAVYAIAHSLKAVLEECSSVTASPHQCVDGPKLRDALSKVNFQGELVQINFNFNGSGHSNYEINNIHVENGELIQRKVGMWNTSLRSFTFFDMDNVIWSWNLSNSNVTNKRRKMHPVSICSKPCPAGFTRVYTDRCCWKCFPCQKNERTIIVKNVHFCDICPTVYNFTWPDKYTRRECLPIPATFDDLSGWVGPCLFSFNILVFLSALTVAILYVINRNRRIIKASSREISLMMLGGHVIVCLCVTTHFIRPYIVTCTLKHFWLPMSFSVTYGPLLVKTNRIYRIFIMKQMTTKRPPLISSQAQIFIVLIIIGIQILLSGLDLVLHPPRVTFFMPSIYEKYVEQVCAVRWSSYSLSLFYIFLLIIGCIVHAYNVRNLPTNYNEAKFIIISMYCFGLLWIGVISGFFMSESRIIQYRWLIAFMLSNMLVSQAFLLYPKLFAIYHDNIGTITSTKNRSIFSEFVSIRPPSHR